MKQEEFDALFKDAVTKINENEYSKEHLLQRLQHYSTSEGKIDQEELSMFLFFESQEYTQILLKEILEKIYVKD